MSVAAVAVSMSIVGGNGPALGASGPPAAARRPLPTYVAAAEGVAGAFVAGYESYSYADGPTAVADRVAPYATADLHSVLAQPSQGGAGAALSQEKAVATASANGFQVESADPASVLLLATAVVRTSSLTGASITERYVALKLVDAGGTWKVADVDGLMTHLSPGPPAAPAPPAPSPVTPAPGPAPAPAIPAPPSRPASAPAHLRGIPDDYLSWYEEASTTCPGLSWAVLAAIGTVESDNGQSSLPGVHSGANYAGAEGPMQFLPATFAAYGVVAPGGQPPPSPYDPPDAIWSAARLLCADGAGSPAGLYGAIFAYNHSAAYVADVLALAGQYQTEAGEKPTASGSVGLGSVIVKDAEALIGTPYVWGGENPGVGFDCSGLVQWVFAEAGIDLPRVAQSQYDSGPHLPGGAELYAGDLVFFGSGPRGVEHVGIYIGGGQMVDAPHTGAVVRIEPVAGFSPAYVAATRPEIPDLSSSGPGLPTVLGSPTAHPTPPSNPAHRRHPQPSPDMPPTTIELADAPTHHHRHRTDPTGSGEANGSTTSNTTTSNTGKRPAWPTSDPAPDPTSTSDTDPTEASATAPPEPTSPGTDVASLSGSSPNHHRRHPEPTPSTAPPASPPTTESADAAPTEPTTSSPVPPATVTSDPPPTTTSAPPTTTSATSSGGASPYHHRRPPGSTTTSTTGGWDGSGAGQTTTSSSGTSSWSTPTSAPTHHRRRPVTPTTSTTAG